MIITTETVTSETTPQEQRYEMKSILTCDSTAKSDLSFENRTQRSVDRERKRVSGSRKSFPEKESEGNNKDF